MCMSRHVHVVTYRLQDVFHEIFSEILKRNKKFHHMRPNETNTVKNSLISYASSGVPYHKETKNTGSFEL